MAENKHIELLKKCIDSIMQRLSRDEAIIRVKQGRIRPGRQVFHYYKFDIAEMDAKLQNPPRNRRVITLEINQDGNSAPVEVDGAWQPFDHMYAD